MLRALVLSLFLSLAACQTEAPPADTPPAMTSADSPAPESMSVEDATACAAPASSAADDTVTVVFFGDSLTAGYGLGDPASEAYPGQIEAEAREVGLPVETVNAGVSGETTAGGLRRIQWFLSSQPDLDVFVLALGGNDGLRGLDPEAMKANLEGIFDCVRQAHPEARLVLAGMEAPPNMGEGYTARFRSVFPAVAEAAGAARVPFLLDGVGGVARLNQADGVHPTAEGQRVMTQTVWQVLAPLLREGFSDGAGLDKSPAAEGFE